MVTKGWAPICVDLKFVLASGILEEKTERDSQVIKNKIDTPLIYYFKYQKLSSSATYDTEKYIPARSLFTALIVTGTYTGAGTWALVPIFPLFWCCKKDYVSSENTVLFL